MARKGFGVRRSFPGASIRVGPKSIPTPQWAPSYLERAGAYPPECLISSDEISVPHSAAKLHARSTIPVTPGQTAKFILDQQ